MCDPLNAPARSVWTTAVKARPNFADSKVKFQGAGHDWPALKNHYMIAFGEKSLSSLLGPVARRPILRPSYPPQIQVMVNNNGVNTPTMVDDNRILTLEETNTSLRIEAAREKVEAKYELGVSILMKPLGVKPLGELNDIFYNQEYTWCEKFDAMYTALNNLYGKESQVIMIDITNKIERAPVATNIHEALLLLTLIRTVDIDLRFFNPLRGLSESEKRFHCIKKLCPIVFRNIIRDLQGLDDQPPWTFNKIVAAIDKERDTLLISTLSVTSSEVTVSDPGASSSLVNSTNSNTSACKNCQDPSHFVRDCKSFCKLCTNPTVPHLHHPMDCPEFVERKAQKARQQGNTRQTSDRVKTSHPRENIYDNVMSKRSRPNKVNGVHKDSGRFDDELEDEDDYIDYLPDQSYILMVKASHTRSWSDSFLDAHEKIRKFFLVHYKASHDIQEIASADNVLVDLSNQTNGQYIEYPPAHFTSTSFLEKNSSQEETFKNKAGTADSIRLQAFLQQFNLTNPLQALENLLTHWILHIKYCKLAQIFHEISPLSSDNHGWSKHSERNIWCKEEADFTLLAHMKKYEHTNMCYTTQTSLCNPTSLNMGMIDSGANISISHPHLATILNLEPVQWPTPIPIIFGNSSDDISTHYINLGPILGKIALVDTAQSTIISKKSILKHKISILFRSDHVCQLIHDDGSILYEATLVSADEFFTIPLTALLPSHLQEVMNASLSLPCQGIVNGRKALPAVTLAEIEEVMSLHKRMYHPSCAVMARALRYGAWLGENTDPTLVERVFKHQDCLHCALGKMKRLPRHEGSQIKPLFGEEISIDYLPVTNTAKGNYNGAYIMVERSSGYGWTYLTTQHKTSQIFKAVNHVRQCILRYGYHLKTVRTDAGRVENSQQLAAQLAELNITVHASAPEAQYQNFVERFIQTATRGIATTLLAQRFLDNSFWGMALLAWTRAWNCRPNTLSGDVTPHFLLTAHHPSINIQFRFPFGTPVVSRNLKTKATKLGNTDPAFKFAPSGELGFAVGNTESLNGASLVFFPKKGHNTAFVRVDLQEISVGNNTPTTVAEIERHMESFTITQEGVTLPINPLTKFPTSMTKSEVENTPEKLDNSDGISFTDIYISDTVPLKTQETTEDEPVKQMELLPIVNEDRTVQEDMTELDINTTTESNISSLPQDEDTEVVVSEEGALESVEDTLPPMSTEAEMSEVTELPETSTSASSGPATGTRSQARKRDHSEVLSTTTPSKKRVTRKTPSDDNPTVGQALKSEQAEKWTTAIATEIKNLSEHGTGTEISRNEIPSHAQILPCKVLLKIKRDTEGNPIKYKARLVALGNLMNVASESHVFAPTANPKSLKLLLAVATARGLPLRSIDVYGAFLYPTQEEEVYIAIPTIITAGNQIFWKLNKTMYGLPTSPAAFYEHVSEHLIKMGYKRCVMDPCFFYFITDNGFILTVVHVDDFAATGTTEELLDQFIVDLETNYIVSVNKEVRHFLGLHITEDPTDGSRTLAQPGLLKKLADKYDHVTKLSNYPVVPMSSSFNDAHQADSPSCDKGQYMELLGGLLYMVKTRPDISYAINRLAMRSTVATEKDFNALFRVLAYLYNTRSLGIKLKAPHDHQFILETWSDAAYAVHTDGKSHSGYGFKFESSSSGLFFSRSTKQKVTALSSTEAELNAAVEAVTDTIWYRGLLAEIGFPQKSATNIYVDNASLITIASAFSGKHARVKHFLVRINFLIDQVKLKAVKFKKIHTDLNIVDGLTKPLGPMQFIPKRDSLLGMSE